MPVAGTQLSTISQADSYKPDSDSHIFIFSDNYQIALWIEGGINLYYAVYNPTSQTWGAKVSAGKSISSSDLNVYSTTAQIGDTAYYFYNNAGTLTQFAFPWNAATHTMGTITTTVATTADLSSNVVIDLYWNSTNSVWYLASAGGLGFANVCVITYNSSLVKQHSLNTGAWGNFGTGQYTKRIRMRAPSQTAATFLMSFDQGSGNHNLYLWPITVGSGGTITQGSQETVYGGTTYAITDHTVMFDSSNQADIIIVQSAPSIAIVATKRTGTNAYTAPVTLAAPNNSTTQAACIYNGTTGDLWVFYTSTANQANGEIYVVKRISGAWLTPALAVGGDANGYYGASAAAVFAGSAAWLQYTNAHAFTSSGPPYALSFLNGTAPNTPTVTAPSGNTAATNTTPTIVWPYVNVTPGDGEGAFEIVVARVSDSVVMWDSGKVSSAALSDVYGTNSNTGDVNYVAPATLAYGIQYNVKVRLWDTIANLASSYSGTVNFTLYQGPAASIMSVAAPTGGTASNGTNSGKFNGSTAANATTWVLQTGQGANFTQGNLIAGGAAPNVDQVTALSISGDTITIAPTTAPTLATAAGTTLGVGVYKYAVTDVGPNGETSAGPQATVTTTTSTTNVNLTNIPLAPAGSGITARRIYRTAVGGSQLKLLTTINDNTTTTFTDNIADAALGTNVPTTSAHSALDPVVQAANNLSLGATTMDVTFDIQQPQGDSINYYQLTLLDQTGTQTIAQTVKTLLSPSVAPGNTVTATGFSAPSILNGSTYLLNVAVWDATTNLQLASANWTLPVSFVAPAAPTGFAAIPNNDLGNVALAWVNAGAAVTVNVLRRLHNASTWTTIHSGDLRTVLTDWSCPVMTAVDYGVQTVDNHGLISLVTIASSITLNPALGKYGHWLNDMLAPSTSAMLGALKDFASGTTWAHVTDELSIMPMGNKAPKKSYGPTDYRSTKSGKGTTRTYWLPATDSDGTVTITALGIINQLLVFDTIHHPLLYRDPNGFVGIVQITDVVPASDDGMNYVINFDMEVTDIGQAAILVA